MNPQLYLELKKAGASDIKCFRKVLAGIKDFAKITNTKAENLPPKEEAAEIDQEFLNISASRAQAGTAITVVSGAAGNSMFGGSTYVKIGPN